MLYYPQSFFSGFNALASGLSWPWWVPLSLRLSSKTIINTTTGPDSPIGSHFQGDCLPFCIRTGQHVTYLPKKPEWEAVWPLPLLPATQSIATLPCAIMISRNSKQHPLVSVWVTNLLALESNLKEPLCLALFTSWCITRASGGLDRWDLDQSPLVHHMTWMPTACMTWTHTKHFLQSLGYF